MRAKPDLIPDCDVHGTPMYRDQCRGWELGLTDGRDVVVWRCSHHDCGRYFLGTLGYCSCIPADDQAPPTPRCAREGAFLVVQRAWNLSICPVDGCPTKQPWHAPDHEMAEEFLAAR
jgi:hypothetical protein